MRNEDKELPSDLGLDLVRATEAAALAAGRWMGLGDPAKAHRAATEAMCACLDCVAVEGRVALGKESRMAVCDFMQTGRPVGTGSGPRVDIVADPIDGQDLVAGGLPGAISVIVGAPRGAFWSPGPAAYMEKIVVDAEVAEALVPECLDAPAGWTLALVGRVKGKDVSDLTVFVLDRPRHTSLIAEVRAAGAHVMLRGEGDVTGALMAAMPGGGVDVLLGTGGIPEGLVAACALKAMGGGMLGRLAPRDEEEKKAVERAGFDPARILTIDELVRGDDVFFAATGITDGRLLDGVRYDGRRVRSNSLLIRGKTSSQRHVHAEHLLEARPDLL